MVKHALKRKIEEMFEDWLGVVKTDAGVRVYYEFDDYVYVATNLPGYKENSDSKVTLDVECNSIDSFIPDFMIVGEHSVLELKPDDLLKRFKYGDAGLCFYSRTHHKCLWFNKNEDSIQMSDDDEAVVEVSNLSWDINSIIEYAAGVFGKMKDISD